MPEAMLRAMSEFGEPVPLPAFGNLPVPVCAHPDMLVAKINGKLLTHLEYLNGRELLKNLGIPFAVSYALVRGEYPLDIRLNCLATDTLFLSYEKYVSREAMMLARQAGLRRVPVSQGYTKCSCACAKNAIATMDPGIAKAASAAGAEVLLLEPSVIGIERYNTGFIGGASVLLDENTLGFFGNIEAFGQYQALAEFFESRGVRLVSLGDAPLFDYGGAVDIEA